MRPSLTSDDTTLEAARDCVREFGASVSTTVIAERAGLSQATLFKRFGSKTELLIKAFGYDDLIFWLAKIEAGPDDRCVKEQLLELAQALTAFFVETLPSMMALWSAGPSYGIEQSNANANPRESSPAFRSRMALTSWFAKAQSQGRLGELDPHALAIAFMGTMYAPATRLHLGEDRIDVESYVTAYINGLWSGISPR